MRFVLEVGAEDVVDDAVAATAADTPAAVTAEHKELRAPVFASALSDPPPWGGTDFEIAAAMVYKAFEYIHVSATTHPIITLSFRQYCSFSLTLLKL